FPEAGRAPIRRLPRRVHRLRRSALSIESPLHPRAFSRALLHARCDQKEEADGRVDGDVHGDPGHLHQGRSHHHVPLRLRCILTPRGESEEEEGRHLTPPEEHLHHCRAHVRGARHHRCNLSQVASGRVQGGSRAGSSRKSEAKRKPRDEHYVVLMSATTRVPLSTLIFDLFLEYTIILYLPSCNSYRKRSPSKQNYIISQLFSLAYLEFKN
ncbi:hypothetical protein PMAYCL1PPCAC_26830, partial [Pristionchus mayeri]